MVTPPAIKKPLDRDQLLAALDELRRLVEALPVDEPASDETQTGLPECDEPVLIETRQAAERFGIPDDRIRRLCRDKGMGQRRGGRWLVDAGALWRHLKRARNVG